MRSKKSSLVFFLFILCVTFSIMSVEARKHHTKKTKNQKKDKGGSANSGFPGRAPAPAPLPPYGSSPTHSNIFDILSFGAKGNGVCDDSKVSEINGE